jgi:hypothetical protein
MRANGGIGMMIEVITFQLPEGMTRADVIKNYNETVSKWRGVKELIRKSYLYDGDARLGGGVYHWKSVEAADKWHGDEFRAFVRNLYGSDPVVQRFEVPIVADNALAETIKYEAA